MSNTASSPTPDASSTVKGKNKLTGDLGGTADSPTVVGITSGSASNLNSGTLPAGRMPALTGDVTTSAGAVATTLAAGVVTNAKFSASAGEPGAAWASWTPTLSGRLDDADWTKACKYQTIGKTCNFRISLTSTAVAPAQGGAGEFTITLPVTTVTYPGTATLQLIGEGKLFDATGLRYIAQLYWATTTTAHIRYLAIDTAGTPDTVVDAACSATVPFTWTTSDEILLKGVVEVA